MNVRKVSSAIAAAVEYLRVARGACEDDQDAADDIQSIIVRLHAIDPDGPRGPLTVGHPKDKATVTTKYAAAEARRLRNAHPEWSLRELGQQLHFLGFRARTGAVYSGQMVNHLLKQGR